MSDNKKFEDAVVKLDFLRGNEESFKDAISKLDDKLNNSTETENTINITKDQKSK